MASFVIHHACGCAVLDKLNLSEEEKMAFLMGNLIVDSTNISKKVPKNLSKEEEKEYYKALRESIQEEKISTHFRDRDKLDLSIQAPNCHAFTKKYQNILNDPATLGYLFHLYTDKMFFDNLFNHTFIGLDKDQISTPFEKETKFIKVLKNNKLYSTNDFWDNQNKTSIYEDYTTMNKVILNLYPNLIPISVLRNHTASFINPGIKEVNFQNISEVLNKTAKFIEDSYSNTSSNLNIFDINLVSNFIPTVVDNFFLEYGYLFQKETNFKPIIEHLRADNKTLATMESCTGGGVANAITSCEGASEVLKFSAVTYSNEYKIKMGVSSEVIDKYSVYSIKTAHEMALKIAMFANADIGIGITGKLNRYDRANHYGLDNEVFVSIYYEGKYHDLDIIVTETSRSKNKEIIINSIIKELNRILKTSKTLKLSK